MSAGKIIAYIAAGILIFFGVLFIWSAFNPQGQGSSILVGIITCGIGFGIISFAARSPSKKVSESQTTTLKIDLAGDVNLETLKCKSCGGSLTADNIKMIAGAPMVSCPYCKTTYQLTEEPKW